MVNRAPRVTGSTSWVASARKQTDTLSGIVETSSFPVYLNHA
jgi:hypothetical protein